MRMRPTAGEESTSDRSGSGDRCPRCSYSSLRTKHRLTWLTPAYLVMGLLSLALSGDSPIDFFHRKVELICERCGFTERMRS